MSFLVLPPEINSLRMFVGAGSAPMLEAAAAWDGLASELATAASSFTSVTSRLTGQAWQGPASAAMMAAATPYAGFLSAAAAHAQNASTQAQSVAAVFESSLAATVHPAVVAGNRSDLVSLVMSNLFGQNAPAIAATEADYEQMWAQDVAAMVDYHAGASAAAAQLPSALEPLDSIFGVLDNIPGYSFVGVSNRRLRTLGSGISSRGISAAATWARSICWAAATSATSTSAAATSASGTWAAATSAA